MNIARILYSLEQRWGTPVDIYREITSPPDLLTGVIAKSRSKTHIRKAIVLSGDAYRTSHFFRSKFNIGVVETADSVVIVNIKPTLNDYVIINHQRYEISKIESMPPAYMLLLKEYVGSTTHEIHEYCFHDRLWLTQEVNND